MSVPAFIDVAEADQAVELRQYLKGKGAEISEENTDAGLQSDLRQIIEVLPICFKEAGSETELEGVLNSIISLILIIPSDKNEELVLAFSEKVSKLPQGDKYAHIRIRALSNLFHGVDERLQLRYYVYTSLIRLAGQCAMLDTVPTDLKQIKSWVAQWDISTQKVQNLLRALHDAFQEAKESEKATKVLVELLGTYTADNASHAREDAHKCIVTCLADPEMYLMDHLLTLKPVKFLEGEKIHDLLSIFVSGKLSDYLQFCKTHGDFVNSLGLKHEDNLQKMRLLTFMQMAETAKEIDFSTIEQELDLQTDEVEAFIIDVVRTKSVRVRVDQVNKKVIISTTTHRTFGKQQWQLLREQLDQWQHNLAQIQTSLQTITSQAQ